MDDLVQFLRDRYDEDERVVRDANTSPEMVTGIPRSYVDAPMSRHISRFADPARVLRETKAKRALLDRFLPDAASADEQINEEWHADSTLADDLLCTMAMSYADHPDYREEWRP